MKKGFLISLVIAMVLGMTACGKENTPQLIPPVSEIPEKEDRPEVSENGDTEDTGASEEAVSEEQKEDQSKEEEKQEESQTGEEVSGDESAEAAEAPAYLDIILERNYDGKYEEVSLMNASYQTLGLRTTGYPALTASVNAYKETHLAEIKEYLEMMKEDASLLYEHHGAENFMGPYEYKSEVFVKRADKEVLSFVESVFAYEGGAHGVNYYTAANFDVQTGAEIQLDDIIKDMEGLPVVLDTELMEKYGEDGMFFITPPKEMLKDYVTPGGENQPEFTWTLGYDGVTFYFSNYELAPYAAGTQVVTVLYSEYPQMYQEKYSANVGDDYVIRLDNNWLGLDTDLNGDGVSDLIRVMPNYNPDYDFNESFDVTVNGNTFTQETYCYELESYLAKSGDDFYLYVQRTVENDYQSVCVFKLTEISVEFMGEFSGGMGTFTNSADFEVRKRMDMLSTYTGIAKCAIGEDGLPVEKDSVYKINFDYKLTSTVEIEAELTDGEGNLTGEGFAFPAGTKFAFVETDGETYVDMLADDGKYCRFYTTNEWPATVNGLNAEESFEMLYLAG